MICAFVALLWIILVWFSMTERDNIKHPLRVVISEKRVGEKRAMIAQMQFFHRPYLYKRIGKKRWITHEKMSSVKHEEIDRQLEWWDFSLSIFKRQEQFISTNCWNSRASSKLEIIIDSEIYRKHTICKKYGI